jgi:hypothetical protein
MAVSGAILRHGENFWHNYWFDIILLEMNLFLTF